MDARILLLASTLSLFGEADTSGSDPTSNVRIFMQIDAEVQGAIVGEAVLPGGTKPEAIEVVSVSEAMFTPLDSGSGLPTGQRRYEGVVVRKPMDKTTPQIGQALANSENLEEVELLVYIENRSTRQLELRFRHTLEDARVIRIHRDLFGKSSTSTELVPRPEEEVTIKFQSFLFEDVVNGIQYQDDIGTIAVDVPVTEQAIEDSTTVAADGQAQTSESTMD